MFTLIDDGTKDTVLVCEECNEEQRYNWHQIAEDISIMLADEEDYTDLRRFEEYDNYVDAIIKDANSEHECDRGYEGRE